MRTASIKQDAHGYWVVTGFLDGREIKRAYLKYRSAAIVILLDWSET